MGADVFHILTLISLGVKIVVFLIFVIIRYKLYILSFKLSGPLGLPIVGNLPSFLFKKGTFFCRANEIILENKETFRFWIGMNLLIVFKKTEDIEKILNAPDVCKGSMKSFIRGYNFQSKSTDEKWRTHKKDMKLIINPKFFSDNMEIFQKHITSCMNIFDDHADKEPFDIFKYIQLNFIDIFGELILGTNIGAQSGKNNDFIKSIDTINIHNNKKILFSCFHQWLLYKCTRYHRETKTAKGILNEFLENVIIKSWERRKFDVFGENSTGNIPKIVPIVDQIGEYLKKNPNEITKEEYRDYLKTFFVSSEKTVSIVTAYACLCFGMYPEYQHEAVKEINAVLNEDNNAVKFEDLQKLKYLEMCVQEVQRLVTVRPYIMRRFDKAFHINNLNIPSYCDILIPLYAINRNPEIFQKPNEFFPDHFLPDAIKTRHFNYTFGGGFRECMGKSITMLGIKLMLVNILRRYTIEADGNLESLKLKADPFTTSTNGYNVRLKHRH